MTQEHEVRTEIQLHHLTRAAERIAAELAKINDAIQRIAYAVETATESHLDHEQTSPNR